MINYPRNVISIVYFLSSNLFTERIHSAAIIPQPCLRSICDPISTIANPITSIQMGVIEKTHTLLHLFPLLPESLEVKPVEDTPIFSPPCTLLPLEGQGIDIEGRDLVGS